MLENKKPQTKKVAVIGAGWFGAHIAIELAKLKYDVTLFEKNSEIFSGVSATFGIRLHNGPHYPRSFATRKTCWSGKNEFRLKYPDLINEHEHSIYAIGKTDADGNPSKTTEQDMQNVCQEFEYKDEVDLDTMGYNKEEILGAFDIDEPSAILGPRLKEKFQTYLAKANVKIKLNALVTLQEKVLCKNKILVGNQIESQEFDHVVNTTGFQSLLPSKKSLPFDMSIVFQPCMGLLYKKLKPGNKPISFIVMDGWFPCLMPYDNRSTEEIKKNLLLDRYTVTHGKYTILGSYVSAEEANQCLSLITHDFVEKHIRNPIEAEMKRFWPTFLDEYKYEEKWKIAVLAKIKTNTEFRGAVTFQDVETGVIYVFPGKITNIFDSERETLNLLHGRNVVLSENGYRYVKGGILDEAEREITEPIQDRNRITCELQPFKHILEPLISKKEQLANSKIINSAQNTTFAERKFIRFPNKEEIVPRLIAYTALYMTAFIGNKYIDKEDTTSSIFLAAINILICTWLLSTLQEQRILKEENQTGAQSQDYASNPIIKHGFFKKSSSVEPVEPTNHQISTSDEHMASAATLK